MTRNWIQRTSRFLKNEEGVTAVECAIMLALVVVICLVALSANSNSRETGDSRVVAVDRD